jgi:hypothetical protein
MGVMQTIALLLPFLLLVTPAIAHATNEGSYRFGYSAGYDDYHNCFIGDCSPSSNDEALGKCVVGNQAVTNSTACLDGRLCRIYARGSFTRCSDIWT